MSLKTIIPYALAVGLACSMQSCVSQPSPTKIEVSKGAERAYILTKEQGEKQLEQLAKTSRKEDAWLCVEDENGTMWYDIGSDEKKYQVTINLKRVLDVSRKSSAITEYHIHPFSCGPSAADFSSDSQARRDMKILGIKMKPSIVFSPLGKCSYSAPEEHEKLMAVGVEKLLKLGTECLTLSAILEKLGGKSNIKASAHSLKKFGYSLSFEEY